MNWQVLPDFGRTASAVTLQPVTATGLTLSAGGPRLEYGVYLFQPSQVTVDAIFAPTQKFLPDNEFRFALAFDDAPPQVINFHEGYTPAEWNRSVADGARVISSKHSLAQAGYHTLKFWALDAGLVLEKLIVNTGGLKPSYLGPPQSFYQKP